MTCKLAEEEREGQGGGHGTIVDLGEAEGGLAQLAVFLLRMGQPFQEALLVDELDAAAAFARIK